MNSENKMQNKITLEEHVSSADNNALWDDKGEAQRNGQAYMDDVEWKLLDVDKRLDIMDQCGIDATILSLT